MTSGLRRRRPGIAEVEVVAGQPQESIHHRHQALGGVVVAQIGREKAQGIFLAGNCRREIMLPGLNFRAMFF